VGALGARCSGDGLAVSTRSERTPAAAVGASAVSSASRAGGAGTAAWVVALTGVLLDAAGVNAGRRGMRPTMTPPRKMTTDTTAAVMNRNARCLPVSWMSNPRPASWLLWMASFWMPESTPGATYNTDPLEYTGGSGEGAYTMNGDTTFTLKWISVNCGV